MAEEHSVEGESLEETGKKRLSGKKLALFVLLPLILILGGGAGLYFSGALHKFTGDKKHDAKTEHAEGAGGETAQGPGYYYDLADIIVNLNDENKKQRFLKLSISIEIPKKEDEPKLVAVMPRITDHFQTYLRELRVEDLRGSAGIYRLRQELLARVKAAAKPVEVRDILFREILVQ